MFARRSNPSVDSPILRKSKTYVEEQVASGRADWVDLADPRKGIICREMLYFGERALPEETPPITNLPVELPGIIFVDPNPARNRALMRWRWVQSEQQLAQLAG